MRVSAATNNLADDTSDELRNKHVVEIDNGSKEWMVVVPKGKRWSKDNKEG